MYSTVELSPRLKQCHKLMGEGKSNKKIATIMNISYKTAKFYTSHVMQFLGKDRYEIICQAQKEKA